MTCFGFNIDFFLSRVIDDEIEANFEEVYLNLNVLNGDNFAVNEWGWSALFPARGSA